MQKEGQSPSVPLSIGKVSDEALRQSWVGHGKGGVHQLHSAEEEGSKHDLQPRNV